MHNNITFALLSVDGKFEYQLTGNPRENNALSLSLLSNRTIKSSSEPLTSLECKAGTTGCAPVLSHSSGFFANLPDFILTPIVHSTVTEKYRLV